MISLKREEFKADPVYFQLFQQLMKNHKVANHTEKVLLENQHVKDFCEEAEHFLIMDSTDPIYISYVVSSWFKAPLGVQLRFDEIIIYDDFMEYERARNKGLHSGKDADIPNIN